MQTWANLLAEVVGVRTEGVSQGKYVNRQCIWAPRQIPRHIDTVETKEIQKRLLRNILDMRRNILSALAFEERTIGMGYMLQKQIGKEGKKASKEPALL